MTLPTRRRRRFVPRAHRDVVSPKHFSLPDPPVTIKVCFLDRPGILLIFVKGCTREHSTQAPVA